MPDAEWLRTNWLEILALPAFPGAARGCAVRGCDRDAWAGGLCKSHYQIAKRRFRGDPQSPDALPGGGGREA